MLHAGFRRNLIMKTKIIIIIIGSSYMSMTISAIRGLPCFISYIVFNEHGYEYISFITISYSLLHILALSVAICVISVKMASAPSKSPKSGNGKILV